MWLQVTPQPVTPETMRSRFLVVATVLSLAAACSDAPTPLDPNGMATRLITPPNGALDQSIYDLVALYPKGTETAALNRWNNVKKAYDSGNIAQAKSDLLLLAPWLVDKSSTMSDPPGDETRAAASARLVLYMATYVFSGPSTPVPSLGGGADNAVGIVTPAAGGTIVTPSTRAGVSVPPGAVDVNTIIVITENPTPYPANCSGPLPTKLCQYPRFYHFSQFPHQHLNVGAKFAVCHVNAGSNRYPLEDHDDFRLAHNQPSLANKTPGSTFVDGIEILPLIHQTFSFCDDVEYALNEPTGLDRVLAVASSAIAKFLTPKSAYAVDQGGGGESFEFSDFNIVDPLGVPDDTVSFPGVTFAENGDMSVSYIIGNRGTATAPPALLSLSLTPVAFEGPPPPPIPWTAAGIISMVPGQSLNYTSTAPVTGFSGTYTLTLSLSSDPGFPDSNLANNVRQTSVTIGPVILKKGKVIRK